MKTVIFDLDGTLADTSGDLIAAANASFSGAGQAAPLDPVADALTAFHGGRAMLSLGLTRLKGAAEDADVDALYPPFLAHYRDNIDQRTELYPGCEQAVRRLRADGWAVGICTNKPEGLSELLLQRLGVRDLFDSLIAADTLAVKKPDPEPLREAARRAGGDPGRMVLIGDTETDLKTARAASVPVVLVGFGPEGEGVRRMAPDAVLSHYDALDTVVSDLIG